MKKRKHTPQSELALPIGKSELKAWREQLCWTQRDAASWLGVALRSYENWESGHRNPQHPIGIRARMAQANERRERVPRKRLLQPKVKS